MHPTHPRHHAGRRTTGPMRYGAAPAALCCLVLLVGLGAASLATTLHPAAHSATLADGPVAPVGYWLVASDGGVFAFGDAGFHGSAGDLALNRPIVGMAATPDGGGYWLVASDGGVFSYGDAAYYGSTGDRTLNSPVVGVAATPDGRGYWLVAADGGVFSFGDAGFHGSSGGTVLNSPVVGVAATPTGGGYWLVASDGGVFSFGDAGYHGSAGSTPLVHPISAIDSTADGGGYWLAASDGGVFSYGDARFHGSAVGLATGGPTVDLRTTADGGGYWLAASDGGVFSFGDAPFFGSVADLDLHRPVVGMAVDDRTTLPGRAFTIGGDLVPPLVPGTHEPIDLVITNPDPVPITVVSNRTTVTTTDPSCPPTEFTVTQGLTRPVTVPATTTVSLSGLGVDRSDWPSLAMPDTAFDQDGCQGRHLTLHYQGTAVG